MENKIKIFVTINSNKNKFESIEKIGEQSKIYKNSFSLEEETKALIIGDMKESFKKYLPENIKRSEFYSASNIFVTVSTVKLAVLFDDPLISFPFETAIFFENTITRHLGEITILRRHNFESSAIQFHERVVETVKLLKLSKWTTDLEPLSYV